jgi:spore coat polysaccharide biosynthesis predicted glycosyltransferase SpsG
VGVVDLLERDTDPSFVKIFRDTCATTLAVTDDSNKRVIETDLVINCNPAQDPAWYADQTRYRLGLGYFFADSALVARRRTVVPPRRGRRANILIAFGGHARYDSKLTVVRALEPLSGELTLDILVSPLGPTEEGLRRYLDASRWTATVHQNIGSEALADLFARADLVICSMGNTGYDALVVGCPVLAANQVPRQNEIASCLAARGCVVNLGMIEQLDPALLRHHVSRLIASDDERLRMCLAGQAQCDGQGLARVADLVLQACGRKTPMSLLA